MKAVLIVDDERLLLDALCAALEPWSCQIRVLMAENGREAINHLSHKTVDLLLVDLIMPEVDGFQVVTYVKRHCPGTRVVVMSGLEPSQMRDRMLGLNPFAYIEKPLDFGVMVGLIRSVLEEPSAVPPAGIRVVSLTPERRMTRVLSATRRASPETEGMTHRASTSVRLFQPSSWNFGSRNPDGASPQTAMKRRNEPAETPDRGVEVAQRRSR